MSIRLVLLSLFLFILFCACNKDQTVDTATYRLKSINSVGQGDSNTFRTQFIYDVNNRLVKLIDSVKPNLIRETFITYNSSGNVVKFSSYYLDNPSTLTRSDSLAYNGNSQVIKKFSRSANTAFAVSRSYTYDGLGRVITDSIYASATATTTPVVYGYIKYEYDNNTNITKTQQFYISSATAYQITSDVVYDSKSKPYGNFAILLYAYTNDFSFLSSNNVVSQNVHENAHGLNPADDYAYENIYQYAENGFPKKVLRYWKRNGGSIQLSDVSFIYE